MKKNLTTALVLVLIFLCRSLAADETTNPAAITPDPQQVKVQEKKSDDNTLTLEDMRNIVIMIGVLGGLGVALVGIFHYYKDVDRKRLTDALELYDRFDKDTDAILAMRMVDYYEREATLKQFTYDFHGTETEVKVTPSSKAFRNALSKHYTQLSDEERAIRFIVDVWIGWLERIAYCYNKRYYKTEELVFYRYWLDLLVKDKFEFVRKYAETESCKTLVPFLETYETSLRPKIEKMQQN